MRWEDHVLTYNDTEDNSEKGFEENHTQTDSSSRANPIAEERTRQTAGEGQQAGPDECWIFHGNAFSDETATCPPPEHDPETEE